MDPKVLVFIYIYESRSLQLARSCFKRQETRAHDSTAMSFGMTLLYPPQSSRRSYRHCLPKEHRLKTFKHGAEALGRQHPGQGPRKDVGTWSQESDPKEVQRKAKPRHTFVKFSLILIIYVIENRNRRYKWNHGIARIRPARSCAKGAMPFSFQALMHQRDLSLERLCAISSLENGLPYGF